MHYKQLVLQRIVDEVLNKKTSASLKISKSDTQNTTGIVIFFLLVGVIVSILAVFIYNRLMSDKETKQLEVYDDDVDEASNEGKFTEKISFTENASNDEFNYPYEDIEENNLRKRDKIKLIYAYIIAPLLMLFSVEGAFITAMYSKYGSYNMSAIDSISFKLTLLDYFPIILPPTMMRFFVVPRRKLKFGIEMYSYMALSFFLTHIIFFTLTGIVIPTLGLLDCLVIYCILSFGAKECSNVSRQYRYVLTGLTVFAVFLLLNVPINQPSGREKQQQYLFTIWEAVALCCVLNMKGSTEPKEPPDSFEDHYKYHEPLDKDDILINTGLAYIGRRTPKSNPYLTPEQTKTRHEVERPFLKLLANKYKDKNTRRILAYHFMVYKEMTLFIIYGMELKKYKELHDKVRTKLREILSEELPGEVITKRNELWQEMAKKFYESYTRNHDISTALENAFLSTLKIDNADSIFTRDGLIAIFNYCREAIARERINL